MIFEKMASKSVTAKALGLHYSDYSKNGDMDPEESLLPHLHGTLVIRIEEARDLPDSDSSWWQSSKDVSDPFAKVQLMPVGVKIAETQFVSNSLFPVWAEEFRLLLCHNAATVKISILDKDIWSGDPIGWCEIDCSSLLSGDLVDDWFPLKMGKEGLEEQGAVRVSMQFHNKGQESYAEAARLLPCYFPPREGCKLRLYQDADTPQLPIFDGLQSPDGSPYTPPRLWRDIFDSILAAEKFIYVAGWSVDTTKSLLRGAEDPDCTNSKIGDLLRCKAEAGVRVLLLIWNDLSSADWLGAGQMGTHDEATETFFAGTSVVVANVGRGWGKVVYTHHQKTVVMDSGDTIVSYLGGIDLTDGRFDTPEFPLFDFQVHHSEDFYQNCTPGATATTGPREPWHDIHARLEGPSALDVLTNFEERWRCQAEDKASFLYEISDEEFLPGNPVEEGGDWVAQVLRSITSDSCHFSEDRLATLHRKRGELIDDSILRAYVFLIRNAESFIYIENQYFLGSAYTWTKERETKSMHPIPREIVSKVVDKMDKGEPFMCYIVIPMFPEGDPTSAPSQEILHWQYLTMEAMYLRIGEAIKERGLDKVPTDFLMFLCLGKQETMEQVPGGLELPAEGTPASLARQTLRHPIYVHSKLMIVDDEYVVVGTANVNQRSMGGSRDTEVAVAAKQPAHDEDHRGEVHTFRMALFAAHLGGYHQAFLQPSSEECVTRVREVSEGFQQVYLEDQPPEEPINVHLLPYPIQVESDGSVNALPGWEVFPDSQASVLGQRSGMLPGTLTT